MASKVYRNPSISFDSSTSLTILVGQGSSQKGFLAHESVICAHSEFFRRAMKGNWAERKERLVKLPDDKPATFALYMNIVYTNVVAHAPLLSSQNPPDRTAEYIELCELYVLSEKLCDKRAKNSVLETMRDLKISEYYSSNSAKPTSFGPSAAAIAIMYAGTPAGSIGRKLMTDMWSTVPPEHIIDNACKLPGEFIKDLAVTLLRDQTSRKNKALSAKANAYNEP
ncbi:hypothetical protein DE146DRAFT_790242 [Phaeosphaeria sp. MPI-PUGE-AT-0046c]|nr:hypothetical protein DE146DRAFT_790242 [Phaeosphaeria sp. MPI-PUGE-AT-0046c]